VSRTPAAAQPHAAIGDKVPALSKTIAIIRFLNSASPDGASLHELSVRLQITKSHCHNILKALTGEGWLAYDDRRRSYSLAPQLLTDISCLIGARQMAHAQIHDELTRLSAATGIPCVLSRVERDGSFVTIDKAEEALELIVSVPIGHRFPPDAPAQMRARLAWMPEDVRKQELARWRPRAYTKTTIVRKKQAASEIEATRRRGYSVSRAEFSPGVMTLAAPIFDSRGNVQMVLQCPGLIERVIKDQDKIATELQRSAQRLNAIFGAPPRAAATPQMSQTAQNPGLTPQRRLLSCSRE
jgi:DNA-binding IclR family transcriptional regulator